MADFKTAIETRIVSWLSKRFEARPLGGDHEQRRTTCDAGTENAGNTKYGKIVLYLSDFHWEIRGVRVTGDQLIGIWC